MGLDDAAIRDPKLIEHKAGLLLMKIHQPNVYMQHGLFPAQIQRVRRMRLAGTFYTIDLVGAPAFRVFVEDAAWEGVTERIPDQDMTLVDAGDHGKDSLKLDARQVKARLPAGAAALLFGVERTAVPRTVVVRDHAGILGSCEVPVIENSLRIAEVHSCELAFKRRDQDTSAVIESATGDRLTLFEPAVTLMRH